MELPTELRHVYRALLRAATYLPDSVARKYIHNRVVHRFRAVADRIALQKKQGATRDKLIARYHSHDHIASVRRDANKLERAGLGGANELKNVLMHTYGRAGKRRRELVTRLLLPEESNASQDGTSLEKLMSADKIPIPPHPESQFGVLLKYQALNPPHNEKAYSIKRLQPKIGKENMWMRPVPLKLVASRKRKWLTGILPRIIPPLPLAEWNHLRDLVTGAMPIEELPKRRPQPTSRVSLQGEKNDQRLLEYFTIPVQFQRNDLDEITIDEEGISCWTTTAPIVKIPYNSRYTHSARFMQRLYAYIWIMTPTMSKDPATSKWNIKYGTGWSDWTSGQISEANTADDELFVGAEEASVFKGKTMNKKKRQLKDKGRGVD